MAFRTVNLPKQIWVVCVLIGFWGSAPGSATEADLKICLPTQLTVFPDVPVGASDDERLEIFKSSASRGNVMSQCMLGGWYGDSSESAYDPDKAEVLLTNLTTAYCPFRAAYLAQLKALPDRSPADHRASHVWLLSFAAGRVLDVGPNAGHDFYANRDTEAARLFADTVTDTPAIRRAMAAFTAEITESDGAALRMKGEELMSRETPSHRSLAGHYLHAAMDKGDHAAAVLYLEKAVACQLPYNTVAVPRARDRVAELAKAGQADALVLLSRYHVTHPRLTPVRERIANRYLTDAEERALDVAAERAFLSRRLHAARSE